MSSPQEPDKGGAGGDSEGLPPVPLSGLAALMPGLVISLYKILRWLLARRDLESREHRNTSRWHA